MSGNAYYWLMSSKTGWIANDNLYASAPNMAGPWTRQGVIAPVGQRTWVSQTTSVLPITGSRGIVNLFFGDRWDGADGAGHPGQNNSLATYVLQPLVIGGGTISMPVFHAIWKLDVAAGTWTP